MKKNSNNIPEVNDTRRKLSKAGLSLPFLMSFSRPLWAGDCAPSDLQSGNLSVRPNEKDCFGKGLSPGYFKQEQHFEYWLSPFTTGQSFNGYFPLRTIRITKGSTVNEDPTFLEVLNTSKNSFEIADDTTVVTLVGGYNVGTEAFHAVAALLNVQLSPHYGKILATDEPFTLQNVIDAYYAGTVVATFDPFEV